jgi:hypothetical protein
MQCSTGKTWREVMVLDGVYVLCCKIIANL